MQLGTHVGALWPGILATLLPRPPTAPTRCDARPWFAGFGQ